MKHSLPNPQCDIHSYIFGFSCKLYRVIPENLVSTGVYQHGRETVKITVEWRCPRQAWIMVSDIVLAESWSMSLRGKGMF